MNKRVFSRNGITFVRVTKAAARKAYEASLNLAFVPGKLSPWYLDGVFVLDTVNKSNAGIYDPDFDARVRDYESYNCNSNETGHYTQFYVAAKDLNRN